MADNSYFVPAALVNKVLTSVITGIVLFGAYCVGWALQDAQHKERVLGQLSRIEADNNWVKRRLDELGDDLDEHETQHTHN